MNVAIPISELPEEERKKIIAEIESNGENSPGCPRCGSKGWHACIGHPVIWTEEDKQRLHNALDKFYGKQEDK